MDPWARSHHGARTSATDSCQTTTGIWAAVGDRDPDSTMSLAAVPPETVERTGVSPKGPWDGEGPQVRVPGPVGTVGTRRT